MRLRPDETELVGRWIPSATGLQRDAAEARIEMLIRDDLQLVRDQGWDQLFRDPADGRYWHLTFRQSEMHGGGPRMLRAISEAEAKAKFGPI